MKILHTSDWHLGASLAGEKRYDEFEKVLQWLAGILKKEEIKAIIIAGDVFDSSLPSNRATELYYSFLSRALAAGVDQIIVTAGNHDSASFLEAPGEILKHLHVNVIGKIDRDSPEDNIIPLIDKHGKTAAVICAVPYLRERDLRQISGGESVDERLAGRQEAILQYYRSICAKAGELHPGIPIIATGHFYAMESGAFDTILDVRVKSLPENISALALGHLHRAGEVAGKQSFWYSGSLLQLDFKDHPEEKCVLLIDTDDISSTPQRIPIPRFRRLEKVTGTLEEIKSKIMELANSGEEIWIHVENTGPFEHDLQQKLSFLFSDDGNKNTLLESISCAGHHLKLISYNNTHPNPAILKRRPRAEKLDQLTPEEVFLRLIDGLPQERHENLHSAFREAVSELEDEKNEDIES